MEESYDIFISYSREDAPQVLPFVEELLDLKFKVWIDIIGIEGGDTFKPLIVTAIDRSRVVLFFSSALSNASPWVQKEIALAVYERKTIVPVLLDHTEFHPDIKLDLISLNHIDFSDPNRRESGKALLIKTLNDCCPEVKSRPDGFRFVLDTPVRDPSGPVFALGALSAVFPLAGWMLYFVYKDKHPRKAKVCLTWAWIGFAVGMLSNIGIFVIEELL